MTMKGWSGRRYACPNCGTPEVELCFSVWVRANDFENRSLWKIDEDDEPESRSDKGWCPVCEFSILVEATEELDDGG